MARPGFKWTPPGSSSEDELELRHPIELEIHPGRKRRRATQEAWDMSSHETFVSSAVRETFRALIRFLDEPKKMLRFLDEGGQAGADYYPDLDSSTSYPLVVLELAEVGELKPDQHRFALGEYSYTIFVRSRDGTSLEPIYDPDA